MSYNLVNELFSGLIKGNRASLSRAITLIESKNCNKISAETRKQLIRAVNEYHMKTRPKTIRIGVSGGPGCGKSTFIESFGMNLIEKYNKKIAVLAIDPSSAINGGSILADKTRMSNLTKNLSAFIRPSPTGGHLGGVTQSTGNAILLCESAGYEIIMIETVGVGQSEYEVSHLCDIMALLVAPSGGDELQAIKKGIVEMANIIIVTKSDGELVKHARKMAAEITSATKFVNFGEKPIVKRCSALTHEGIDDIWLSIQKLVESEEKKLNKRKEQKVKLLKIGLINEIFDLLNESICFKQYEQMLKSNENLLVEDVIQHIIYDDLYRAISNSETKVKDEIH